MLEATLLRRAPRNALCASARAATSPEPPPPAPATSVLLLPGPKTWPTYPSLPYSSYLIPKFLAGSSFARIYPTQTIANRHRHILHSSLAARPPEAERSCASLPPVKPPTPHTSHGGTRLTGRHTPHGLRSPQPCRAHHKRVLFTIPQPRHGAPSTV